MMFKRLLTASAILSLATATLAAQTASKPSAASAASAPPASSSKKYTPPRTPWGDPDLHGNYTNKYEQGTPFERPQEFEGRRIEDIQGQELADVIKRRQQTALERDRFLSGDPTGTIAG